MRERSISLAVVASLAICSAASGQIKQTAKLPAEVSRGTAGVTAGEIVIWDQPWDEETENGYIAQIFPDMQEFSAFEFDDFKTTKEYAITKLIVMGFEDPDDPPGDPEENIDIIGLIWNGLPGGMGGEIVMASVDGSEDAETGMLTIDFGEQVLPGGSYWLTAYVVRPFDPGGQWLWQATTPVRESQEYFYNPGGGFELGTEPLPGAEVFGVARDMVFTLYAIADEECEPCDANCDGSIDLTDVEPFISLLLGGEQCIPDCTGDTNGDGSVDLLDVSGFIDCLLG